MTAIPSLLRVMALRDAEAIILEVGKVPCLRRRGQIESLALPPLDAALLHDFATPILAARGVAGIDNLASAVTAPFSDHEGGTYQVTIDRGHNGLRIVAKRAPAATVTPAPSPQSSPGISAIPRAPSPSPAVDRPSVAPPTATAHRPLDLARLARFLEPAIEIALARDASDIILSSGQVLHLRVGGRLTAVDDVPIDHAELAACVAGLGDRHDASLEVAGVRLRINAFEHLGGVGVAARLIRDRVPTLGDLALPAELQSMIEQRDGLAIVCGPTGSGKSTTLAALIGELDHRRAAHVITLEDPIEYRFQPERCLIHQREVGTHTPSFAAGLRAALRETPDVILVGEMRDRDTIAAALTAAETGHLVLATLHAPSAAGAIDRIIDVFPDTQQRQVRWQLASVLRTVATQYLLPKHGGGRAVAVEHVPVTPAVANIIRKGELQTLPTAINTGRDAGMIPLERSLARLLESGTVPAAAVKAIAADHDLLTALAGRLAGR